MSDSGPNHTDRQHYTVSPQTRKNLQRQQTRFWRRAQRRRISPRRYWTRNQRVRPRSLIQGELITHRRMFGVSHKHVQPGQSPAEGGQ
jgi:hypothetical protein